MERERDHLAAPLQGVIREEAREEETGNTASWLRPGMNYEMTLGMPCLCPRYWTAQCNLETAEPSLCESVILYLLEECEQMQMSCLPKGLAHSPFLCYDQIALYSLSRAIV